MMLVEYDRLNARGRDRLDEMIRKLSQVPKPKCESCEKQSGVGRWREENSKTYVDDMPVNDATCIVWIPDQRVMVDLSHLALCCPYHVDFYPYPNIVNYGNGPRSNPDGRIHVIRQIVWPE